MEYVIAIAVVLVVIYFAFVRGDSSSSTSTTTLREITLPEVVADVNNNGITSKAELKTLTKVQLFDFAEKQNLKVKKSGKSLK